MKLSYTVLLITIVSFLGSTSTIVSGQQSPEQKNRAAFRQNVKNRFTNLEQRVAALEKKAGITSPNMTDPIQQDGNRLIVLRKKSIANTLTPTEQQEFDKLKISFGLD